jgi:glycosyltransferase involved in cell wall biosynthesis
MPPRLVVVESLATLAGGQRVLLDLMPALTAAFTVTVIAPEVGPLTRRLEALSTPAIILPMGARYSIQRKTGGDVLKFAATTPRLIESLAHLLRQQSADLVLLNSSPAFPWGTLGSWRAGRPVVWFSHNVLVDTKSRLLLRLLVRCPNVRRLLAISTAAAAQYRPAAPVTLIPLGVDSEVYRPYPEAREQKRVELRLPADAFAVAIVGDLIRLKGQQVTLQAVRSLIGRYPRLHLLVVGEPRPEADSQAYQAELHQAASAIPNIHFYGRREDLPQLFAAVDGLIIASNLETGPLVLLQALACGTPVVSTPVGLAPAALSQAGHFLFPVGDAAALAQNLEQLMTHPDRPGLGEQGRALVRLHWRLDQMQASVVAALQAALV